MEKLKESIDKMIESYLTAFNTHTHLLEDQNTKNEDYINRHITERLNEKNLLSAKQYKGFKDLYIPQIEENIKIAREQISKKLDELSEVIFYSIVDFSLPLIFFRLKKNLKNMEDS